MSSKVISYYDWSLGFKGNNTDRTSKITLTKKLNSIGIADNDFKNYLRKTFSGSKLVGWQQKTNSLFQNHTIGF